VDGGAGTMSFVPSSGSVGACVCPEAPKPFGAASGTLTYTATNQSIDTGTGAVGFKANKCAQWPQTSLVPQGNPTCDIRHYRGGQSACHHMVRWGCVRAWVARGVKWGLGVGVDWMRHPTCSIRGRVWQQCEQSVWGG
jgi:hypothetical protein